MNCKYCHLNTHFIDKCPTIICKNCKDVGHPQWLCKKNKNKSNNNVSKKYNLSEEIKKKSNQEFNNHKTISYYLKLSEKEWGELL